VVAEVHDEVAERVRGPRDGQLGGDPQGERKAGALLRERRGRGRLGLDARPDEPAQQVDGIRHGQQVKVQPVSAGHRDQARQLVPTRDHHDTRWRARQQGSHLLLRGRVVQEDQHSAPVHLRAVAGRHRFHVGRDVAGGHADSGE
jgi:hypothetical protein